MTYLRGRELILSLTSAVILSACGGKAEPDIPTFDPMDKIQTSEGWNVGSAIAVSPGRDTPKAHHLQTIASGLHDIDFKTRPTAMIPVKPSCRVPKPGINSGKYLIVGDGHAKYPLMKKTDVPMLMTFSNQTVNALAKQQADGMLENGVRKKPLTSNIALPASSMSMKDVFITETSESVAVALGGGGLYNFHLAPGVRLTGVVVYTGETGYNKSMQAAVAGVPDDVPVTFISQKHKATKGCWTRVQNRPDKSWSKNASKKQRIEALKPHWRTFFRRVKKDIESIPETNVISVSRAGHYLIGPAPTNYEDRIPYVAFGGKTIRYSEEDNVHFGTFEENRVFARKVLDQYYNAHLTAARK